MRCLLVLTMLTGSVWGQLAESEEDMIFQGELQQVATGFRFTEGPVWHPNGYLLFSDIPAAHIYRMTMGGDVRAWRRKSGQSNGLTLDLRGRLLACEHGNRRVSMTLSDGTVVPLADRWEGKRFNSPNDLVVRSDGTIFFTDPPYGLGKRDREIPFNGVFRMTPGDEPACLARDFERPNGIALSPAEDLLYVADTKANHLRAFSVHEKGVLSDDRVLANVATPDGIKVDLAGRIFVTSRDGIVVLAPYGERLTVLECPEVPANCAFGGDNHKTLYITARKSVYAVQVVTPGLPVPAATKP